MFHSIEEWALGTHHDATMAVAQAGSAGIVLSVFQPSRPGLGRYGFTNESSAGSTSEHRASLSALEELIRRPDNPFQIENNTSYVATQQDLQDTQYLLFSRSGPMSVYDAMVPSAKPQPGTVPGPGPAVPVPFQTTHPDGTPFTSPELAALDATLNHLADRIIAKLSTASGDGRALAALQSIKGETLAVQASLPDPSDAPRPELRRLINIVLKHVAEGGA